MKCPRCGKLLISETHSCSPAHISPTNNYLVYTEYRADGTEHKIDNRKVNLDNMLLQAKIRGINKK